MLVQVAPKEFEPKTSTMPVQSERHANANPTTDREQFIRSYVVGQSCIVETGRNLKTKMTEHKMSNSVRFIWENTGHIWSEVQV